MSPVRKNKTKKKNGQVMRACDLLGWNHVTAVLTYYKCLQLLETHGQQDPARSSSSTVVHYCTCHLEPFAFCEVSCHSVKFHVYFPFYLTSARCE